MPTARARMLELTDLAPGATARLHFLSITQTGSLCIVDGYESLVAELSSIDAVAELAAIDAVAELHPIDDTDAINTLDLDSDLNDVEFT